MKLFLSSMHPSNRNELLKLVETSASREVLVIPNAWDTYPKDRFERELGHTVDALGALGLNTIQLDLRAATKESTALALAGKAMVWVMAGNTFYLNYFLHTSGFAQIIKGEMEKGLVYGGESAGAAVAGPTIHGVEKVDDPKEAPEVVWDGLGLTDFGVIPHWGWEKYRQPLVDAKTEMEKFVVVEPITNQQAIVINGAEKQVIDNPSDEV